MDKKSVDLWWFLVVAIIILLNAPCECKRNLRETDFHTAAIANAPTAAAEEAEDAADEESAKSPLHEPAFAVPNPSTTATEPESEHSEYHIPAVAVANNDKMVGSNYLPTISIVHKSPDNASGSIIITAHSKPTDYFPAMTISTVASYSNSDSEHTPAIAVSSVSSPHSPASATPSKNKIPSSLFGHFSTSRIPGFTIASFTNSNSTHTPATAVSSVPSSYGGAHSPATANPTSSFKWRNPFQAFGQMKMGDRNKHNFQPNYANSFNRSSSIWNNAKKFGKQTTEHSSFKFPLSSFSKPIMSFFKNPFFRSVDSNIEEGALGEGTISLTHGPATDSKLNATSGEKENGTETTSALKFEETWHTNRQKWEIPLNDAVLQSEEFNGFWRLFQRFLEQQMSAQNAGHSYEHLELPTPYDYTFSANDVSRCLLNVNNPMPRYAPIIIEDTQSCRHFIRCVRGRPIRFKCAVGTLFNVATKTCDHAVYVDCDKDRIHK